MGFEPMTSSLPRRRSTPELLGRFQNARTNLYVWSGRRGSNSRPSAWKADALPTELLPPAETMNDECGMMNERQNCLSSIIHHSAFIVRNGAGGRIRTYVGCEPAGFTARCH